MEKLGQFEICIGVGLPGRIRVHLDAGYASTKTRDLLDEFGCDAEIPKQGVGFTGRCALSGGINELVAHTGGLRN